MSSLSQRKKASRYHPTLAKDFHAAIARGK